jgi:hypothetical protein
MICWISGSSARIAASSSRIANRRRADHAADSAKITNAPSRSTTPDNRVMRSAGKCAPSHVFQCFWRSAWFETRVKVGVERASTSLTESGFRNGFATLVAIRRVPLRLCLGILLGILILLILTIYRRRLGAPAIGKPAERRGRKATGLKRGAMTAGLPARCKLLFLSTELSEQGGKRPGLRRSLRYRLKPFDTGFCTTSPERAA